MGVAGFARAHNIAITPLNRSNRLHKFKMLRIAVVLCLLAGACYAQEPIRPELPSTFFGRYHAWMEIVDKFGRIVHTGTGWRAYNQELGKGVRNTTFQVSSTSFESEYKLELYGNEDTVFDVHAVNGRPECDHYKIGGGEMPSYWNWLEYARYDGMAKFPYWDNPAELQWWRLEVSDEKYRLGVFPEDHNKPAVFERSSGVDNWELTETYETFEAVIPEDIDFGIPLICQRQLRKQLRTSGRVGDMSNRHRVRPGRRPSRIRLSNYRSIALHRRNMRTMAARRRL